MKYDTGGLEKLQVELTVAPVRKWWGGRRVRVDAKVTAPGLEGYKPVENSAELKPKNYKLNEIEAEIVTGAIGQLIVPVSLEMSTCDTESNQYELYFLARVTAVDAHEELLRIGPKKKFDSHKEIYVENEAFYNKFEAMLSEKLAEKTGIAPKEPPYKNSGMDY